MVAIILVNFNGAKDTIDCIESLKELTFKDYIIIVVDNKSTDNSARILRMYTQKNSIVFLEADENKGFAAGNNIGIAFALKKNDVDYIWLLNNDTIAKKNSLGELIKGFEENKNVGVTTSKIYYEKNHSMIWYAGGSINRHTARSEHWQYGKIESADEALADRSYQAVSFVSGCSMLIKREVIERVGKMDEEFFLYEEDADYCLRIADAGYTLIYCPKAVIFHKVNASTGKVSGTVQYYSVRNKYILIKKNYKGLNKILALAYSSLQMWYRCFKNELDWKIYKKGLLSYIKKETRKKFG